MSYCKYCGKKLTETALYCPQCGMRLFRADPARKYNTKNVHQQFQPIQNPQQFNFNTQRPSHPAQNPQQPFQPLQKQHRNTLSLIGFILACFSLLLMCLGDIAALTISSMGGMAAFVISAIGFNQISESHEKGMPEPVALLA